MTPSPVADDALPPILYLPHGGGPLPVLGDPGHKELNGFLSQLGPSIRHAKALLVISAHWEAEEPLITASAEPGLMFDYYGFPEPSYHLRYPASGDPMLATSIINQLQSKGFSAGGDSRRSFDHGLFIPLILIQPDAAITCLQLSLIQGLDPATHIRLGQAIASLRQQGVAIIGSGMSFHNVAAMMSRDRHLLTNATTFHRWLLDTCTHPALTDAQREERLLDWEKAPHARYCHPREEHLLPLHVCYGAANKKMAKTIFDGQVMGQPVFALQWQ